MLTASASVGTLSFSLNTDIRFFNELMASYGIKLFWNNLSTAAFAGLGEACFSQRSAGSAYILP